jgi:phage terminase large subunit-like protein
MTTSQNEEQRPAQAEREELTEEERARLSGGVDWSAGEHAGRKALRIIDRDAADRAALVARLAELTEERDHRKQQRDSERDDWDASTAEVARLRERVRELEADLAATHREYDRSVAAAEAEIATLQYCTCRYCK